MRADRLLSLVYLLKARGKMSAARLAAELEVSPRTIFRDVEALSAAGVPVYSEPGRHGGISLLPGYRTDVRALSEQEAGALVVAIAAPGADALGMGEALASALRTVMAALPDQHRPAAAKLAERIVIDTGGWLPRKEEPLLAVVQEAVLTDRRLHLTYQGRRDEAPSGRTVDPYGLLHSGGAWYLVAAHRGQPRFYRVARLTAARLLDEEAHRPEDLDLRALWSERRASYRSAFTPMQAQMWVRRARLGDLAGSAAGPLHDADPAAWTEPAPPGEGWAAIDAPFGDVTHAAGVVWELGDDVVVVAPADLRREVIERARAILAAYREPS